MTSASEREQEPGFGPDPELLIDAAMRSEDRDTLPRYQLLQAARRKSERRPLA